MTVSVVSFDNCLMHDNNSMAYSNGASRLISMAVAPNELSINSCTLVQSTSDETDHTVFSLGSNETVTITNSILWDNDDMTLVTNDGGVGTINAYNSIIEGGYSGTNILDEDPLFWNPAGNDFTLSGISPALNSGDNAFSSLNKDLAQNNRIIDFWVDMGCYENQYLFFILVDANATGQNNGTSWEDAFTDLNDALNLAVISQQVWVADGTYFTSASNTKSQSFVLSSNVPVYGGFAGNETSLEQRDIINNVTTLSGNIGSTNSSTDNAWHVLYAGDGTGAYYIDGLTIRGGYADGAGVHEDVGAGVLIEATTGSFTMKNCEVFNNFSDYSGGGVATFCESFFYNCNFHDNESHIGGAIQWSNGTTIENCLFKENIANVGIVSQNTGGELDMRGCTLYGNEVNWDNYTVVQGGGGTVANTIIWGNSNFNPDEKAVLNVNDVHHCILQGDALAANVEGDNVFYEDPQFESVPDALNLLGTSVGINAGDNSLVTLANDLEGKERIMLGTVDIGAYESFAAMPVVIYVDADATGLNNGTWWGDAYTDLQTAINAAAFSNADVWVAEGTYKPTSGTNRNAVFDLTGGVEYWGGFSGTENSTAQCDWVNNRTILSGEIGSDQTVGDNSYTIINTQDQLEQVIMHGFEIADAYGTASETAPHAIDVYNATLLLYNCTIRNNYTRNGPALSVCAASVLMESCLLVDNVALMTTGATESGIILVDCNSNDLILVNCTLAGNSINNTNGEVITAPNANNNVDITNTIVWSNNGRNALNGNMTTASEANNCILQGYTAGTNSLNMDPDFVDVYTDNYRIQPWSIAVNTGLNEPVSVVEDLDLNTRIQNTTVDIGCYEASTCYQLNDACNDAIGLNVGDNPTDGTNKCATGGDSPANACAAVSGKTVWYYFTAPASGAVNINLDHVKNVTTNFNPRLALYSGTCNALTFHSCINANGNGMDEILEASGLAGNSL